MIINKYIKKNDLIFLVRLLIVVSVMTIISNYTHNRALERINKGVYVVGKLKDVGRRSISFEFTYLNKIHFGRDNGRLSYSDIGRRFFVKVCSTDVKFNLIYTNLPVPDCIRENPPEGWPEIPDCNAIGGNWYQQIADAPFDAYNFRLKSIYRKEKTETNLTQQFNPVVIRQEMLFYKSEKLVNQMTSPAITVLQILASGEKVEILDNVIKTVKYIKGNGSPIYAIEGFGGCEKNCSHLKLLYNNIGQQLYLEYIKDGQVLKKEGDEMKELENFGIKHDYSNIKVLKEYNMYPF